MVREIIENLGIKWSYGSLIALAKKGNGVEVVYWNGEDWEPDETETLYEFLTANPASDQRLIAHGVIKSVKSE